ncbi:hypothetical protein [Rhodococcus tibetensis]|uniref:Uncharacterized protein n=1 Tax=Rhodococcus tibetensis TaxID=2965064 RepID=A0ABT1QMQ8_9NOCA|nr:hypothetical protein [Rhodococcus sp. FXJ9.536]MCQ4122382.1 hypothetical protein [Rhodococcus sp. FXJ9.536]
MPSPAARPGHRNNEVSQTASPWAYDANSHPVPTRYVVRDRQLIQQVHADAHTAYPILADPPPTGELQDVAASKSAFGKSRASDDTGYIGQTAQNLTAPPPEAGATAGTTVPLPLGGAATVTPDGPGTIDLGDDTGQDESSGGQITAAQWADELTATTPENTHNTPPAHPDDGTTLSEMAALDQRRRSDPDSGDDAAEGFWDQAWETTKDFAHDFPPTGLAIGGVKATLGIVEGFNTLSGHGPGGQQAQADATRNMAKTTAGIVLDGTPATKNLSDHAGVPGLLEPGEGAELSTAAKEQFLATEDWDHPYVGAGEVAVNVLSSGVVPAKGLGVARGDAVSGPTRAEVDAARIASGGRPADDTVRAPTHLPDMRRQYIAEIERLGEVEDTMRAQGASPERIAGTLYAERRAIGDRR